MTGLRHNRQYLFRVAPANSRGAGRWLVIPSPVVTKGPLGEMLHVLLKKVSTLFCLTTAVITTTIRFRRLLYVMTAGVVIVVDFLRKSVICLLVQIITILVKYSLMLRI